MSMMIFIFLCFVGLFFMFYYLVYIHEKARGQMREELLQIRTQLQALEARLTETDDTEVLISSGRADMLDSLSLDETPPTKTDNTLNIHFDPQDNMRR